MQIHTIETCLYGAPGSLGKRLYQTEDLRLRQRPRCYITAVERPRGRPDSTGTDDFAIWRLFRYGLAARVEDLQHCGRPATFRGLGKAPQARQKMIVPCGELIIEADALDAHMGAASDYQAHALHAAAIVSQFLFGGARVGIGGPSGHGCHGQAIVDAQAIGEMQRTKDAGVVRFHGAFQKELAWRCQQMTTGDFSSGAIDGCRAGAVRRTAGHTHG